MRTGAIATSSSARSLRENFRLLPAFRLMFVLLAASGKPCHHAADGAFQLALAGYVAMTLAYSFGLKRSHAW